MADVFDRSKKQRLLSVDLSRKGSIDSAILDLVSYINTLDNFFTTSSCSGRIIVFRNDDSDSVKKGCKWLFTSHEKTSQKDMVDALVNREGEMVFKCEPFIMHIQCRFFQDAQKMHSAAVASGFRNSGITVGTKGKIIMAVRSSHGLEVPLSHGGQLLVSEQYIAFLLDVANRKMEENFRRIDRFFEEIKRINHSEKMTDVLCIRENKKTDGRTCDNVYISKDSDTCKSQVQFTAGKYEVDGASGPHFQDLSKNRHVKKREERQLDVSTEDTFSTCLDLFHNDQ